MERDFLFQENLWNHFTHLKGLSRLWAIHIMFMANNVKKVSRILQRSHREQGRRRLLFLDLIHCMYQIQSVVPYGSASYPLGYIFHGLLTDIYDRADAINMM